MKQLLWACFLALITVTTIAMTSQKTVRVIFFGDSITELGVAPGGYIARVREEFRKLGMADRYELIGSGISGNKVYDLFLRLEKDVLAQKPDIVVIYVGVNDVWHKMLTGTGTDPDKFETFYIAIIKRLQETNVQIILCTPAVIGERTDNSNQQDGDLNLYSGIVRNLAAKYQCTLCDLRMTFLEYNIRNNPTNAQSGILTKDKVHLNDAGNQLVADMLLKELLKKQ